MRTKRSGRTGARGSDAVPTAPGGGGEDATARPSRAIVVQYALSVTFPVNPLEGEDGGAGV